MEVYNPGPALVYLGDPTQASGAGMNFLGHVRGEITVSPQVNISMGNVDAKGNIPLADAVFNSGPQPIAGIPFVDEEKAKLTELLPGSSTVTNGGNTALLLGSGVEKVAVADIGTLCIIPVDEVDQGTNGIDSDNAWWFPRAITQAFGQFSYTLPDGEDILNDYSRDTTIASLYHDKDHAGTTIPKDARPGFRGSPNGAGISGWSLPDHSANL